MDADIFILGETPAKDEVRKGYPFAGRAGGELDKWLSMTNIPRSKCRIDNCLRRWPKNKKQAFWKNGDFGHPTDEYMQGIDRLVGDILKVKPNVVVPMGNYALWALTQNWGITKWWGSILESTVIPAQKLIPVIHPAAVLRRHTWRAMAIWHLQRVKEEAKTPEIDLPNRDFILDPTQQQIDQAVDRLLQGDHITFDTEWYDPEQLACIGFTNDASWAICIPARHPGALDAYEQLLTSDLPKVAHNTFFDVTYLRRAGVSVRARDVDPQEGCREHMSKVDRIVARSRATRRLEDTMVAHHVCWPEIRNRLPNVTSIYTREPYYKEEFKVWKAEEAEGLDSSERTLHIYNCKDASVEDEIWEALHHERDLMNTGRAYDLNMMTLDIMCRATTRGIRADWATLVQMRKENKAEADEMHELLSEIVGWKPNTRSWKDVKKLVYEQLGFRERKSRPTAQDTLMDICAQASDQPDKQTILKTLIKIRQLRNQNSRYVHPCAVDTDGRIRCSWNMAGTKNGRLSASKDKFKECEGPGGFKGRGLPLQTIPYKARKFFIPDEGQLFIIPDLEQAEARIVAYLSEDTRVLRWLREGLDIHSKLAELMFNVPYEEIRQEKKETGKSDRRYLAKTCRHALNYKMGPRTFKNTINEDFIETGLGVTEGESKALREKYLTIHSPLKLWWASVKKELSENQRVLSSPVGRYRKFIDRWNDALLRDAIAFVPQSTVGDLTHMGLYEVDRRLDYAEVLLNIHDGSLIQVPIEKAEEAAEVVKEALTIPIEVNGQELVIPVEVKFGMNWGEPEDSLDALPL